MSAGNDQRGRGLGNEVEGSTRRHAGSAVGLRMAATARQLLHGSYCMATGSHHAPASLPAPQMPTCSPITASSRAHRSFKPCAAET